MRVIRPEDTRKEVPQVVTEVVQDDGSLAPAGYSGEGGHQGFAIEFTPVFSTGIQVDDEDSARLSLLF